MIPCCESVCTRRTLAGLSFFFSGTAYPPVCFHHRSFDLRLALRTPARQVFEESESALPLLSNSLPILANVPLQTHLDFNAIIIVYPYCTVGVFESCFAQSSRFCFRRWVLEPIHASCAQCLRYWVSYLVWGLLLVLFSLAPP